MRILGIAEGSHDASWCLIEDGEILEAHHVERHTRIKNDKWIKPELLPDADIIISHENKLRLEERRLLAGQSMQPAGVRYDNHVNHHDSHAWAGWSTAPFDDCDILVIDAIGEMETTVAYHVRNGEWKKQIIYEYPVSLGLAYSAVTHMLGYKPMEEEYIVMGLAAYGEPTVDFSHLLKINCHRGIEVSVQAPVDVAASIQKFYEDNLLELVNKYCKHENLILMGGCALNCVANSKIKGKDIWIMPNPGDAGSSLGAAAAWYGKKLKWKDPYLGTHIKNDINPREVVRHLVGNGVCGVAHGRAEFGPRALGNRSLLGDPRRDIKDSVNDIKKRQKFRPFAPAILEEYADEYYDGPMNEYMQFVAEAKHDMKSVIHKDGTSRVQIVKKNNKSILRKILEEWYDETGCPMLLNTSLNIKGQPMVNDLDDVKRWEKEYNVKVF